MLESQDLFNDRTGIRAKINSPIKFGNIKPKILDERVMPKRILPKLFKAESATLEILINLYFASLNKALAPLWDNPERKINIGIYRIQSSISALFSKTPIWDWKTANRIKHITLVTNDEKIERT